MKRVGSSCHYFPPIGGAGSTPGQGARISEPRKASISTVAGDSIGRWTPADATLSADNPSGTRVVRVPGPEPQGAGTWSARWGNRAERWLGLPSAWSRWWISGAVEAGAQFDDVDVVYSWMSPYDSAEAALRLSQAIGKPWVADLGDPWALDEMMVFPSGLHRQQELRRMRRLLASAAARRRARPRRCFEYGQLFRSWRRSRSWRFRMASMRTISRSLCRCVATGSSGSCIPATCTPNWGGSSGGRRRFIGCWW